MSTKEERLLSKEELEALEESLGYWNPGQPSWMIPGRGSYTSEVMRQVTLAQDARSYAAGLADGESLKSPTR